MDEAEHDKFVSPLLLQAANEADRLNGTLLAYVEYGPLQGDGTRDSCRTQMLHDPTSAAIVIRLAMMARGNIDLIVMKLLQLHREGEIDLSNSVVCSRFLQEKDSFSPTPEE